MKVRRDLCYTEATDMALREHEEMLRLLYTKYSSGECIKYVFNTLTSADAWQMSAGTSKMLSP
jgi:hypothetical protein